ncbi:RNA 2',3'-cyclic phosphodiesterase [Stutzerimonas stutzeri]|jgi:2'-5' RNA ligase|uniref:RNA 2',3'-cyclic phosphodiesterase n=1 Tax=Stutzerimonas stutzeri TaxID=316 RepID=A0A2N8STQ3_STUST|nr:RNA 2',3'-cyclic phosphodiesterase [Stutzerimonas stutzeri]MCQ4325847.1 RNA 2',3'-cyclic phosphodiesterase [Stutzerimonas stutzeri]PNG05843.1 RNA 2',3'-cyclic phosphodiesterase [Stutzerimonas stutzeri]
MSEPTLRLFFALPCPVEQAAAICAWRDERELEGRPVPRANLHLTLAFLGAQPVDHLQALLELGATVQAPAFQLNLDRLATLGKGFVCLQPSATPLALEYLVAALNERLAALGVVLDSRPFLPHLTLTRQARGRPHGPAPTFGWRAEHFVLYQSQNTPDGVRYLEQGRWPLLAAS